MDALQFYTLPQRSLSFSPTHPLTLLAPHPHTYLWWQALLEGTTDGQAAVVEVADELRVDGSTELRLLSVCGCDENALHRLHQNVVKECVF